MRDPATKVSLRQEGIPKPIVTEQLLALIEVLKNNSNGWTKPWWQTAPGYARIVDFDFGNQKKSYVGIGKGFIARGWCSKSLNVSDAEAIDKILAAH